MQEELLKIWESTRKTVVFVTHDLAEAIGLSRPRMLFTAQPGHIKRYSHACFERARGIETMHDTQRQRACCRVSERSLRGREWILE